MAFARVNNHSSYVRTFNEFRHKFSRGPKCVLPQLSKSCFMCVIVSCTVYQHNTCVCLKPKLLTHCFRQRLEPIFES
ncbi:hypothetical protein HanIR_Chr06g0289241 [Helianthus annuus]|nr:hypothetical protein HanIR_Chr06g0289241 [Helianthus annuus]